jgi:acyl-CoA synthetase (AMP-forming)/AMP-acid ligase II
VSEHTHGSFLDELVDKYGSLPMLKSVHQNRELTYSEFRDMALLVARNLSKFGISKGDAIGVCAGTLWEYAVLQFALGAMGAVLVPLNPAFTLPQFLQALSKSGAKALIIQSQLARGRKEPRDTTPIVEQLTNELKEMKNVFMIPPGGVSGKDTNPPVKPTGGSECQVHPARVLFEGSMEAGTRCTNEFSTAPDETINMQFTSGTTSMPKISCLSHRNLINNGIYIGNRMGLSATKSTHPTGQDHVCVPVPLFHCFGLVLSNLATMSSGGCLVYPSESFDATAVLQSVRLHKCTALHGVPTMFAAELDLDEEIAKGGLSTLRTGIAAGSSVPIEIMKRLESTFGLDKLTICYGMTETSPVSFMTFPHDSVKYRTSTVGSIMPNTYARVVDPTDPTLTPLPTGKNGEIVVAGYLVQSGYFCDPEKTAEAMITDSDGLRWMRTGDEGVMDENGYLVVSGRIKDLIIRGGENIHPLDVENVLFQHPKVSQACVVGVPDKKYGEAVGAFVIVEHRHRDDPPSIEELQELVDSHLGHYMVPKYVYFVDDYPKTPSGKIRKVDLRKVAAELAAKGHGLSRRDAARHATAVAASGA